jgi:hypothetical protein
VDVWTNEKELMYLCKWLTKLERIFRWKVTSMANGGGVISCLFFQSKWMFLVSRNQACDDLLASGSVPLLENYLFVCKSQS